jgi:uncharacterized metal-binding protein YceD (DUF177 family)
MAKRTPSGRRGQPTAGQDAPETAGPPFAELWSVPVQVVDLPDEGQRLELEPDAATREAIGRAAGVLALPRLQAAYNLTPMAGNGVRVAGTVSATVEQTCVVSLEPMTTDIREPIELMFVPPGSAPASARPNPDTDPDDLPEPLVNGAIDLGALAVEHLLLGIDPYPRKPGVVFEPPKAEDDTLGHPFAVLAALKPDPGKKSS